MEHVLSTVLNMYIKFDNEAHGNQLLLGFVGQNPILLWLKPGTCAPAMEDYLQGFYISLYLFEFLGKVRVIR